MTDWYRRHSTIVWRLAFSALQDPGCADECVSETFVRAIRSRHLFRCHGDGVRPWLVTIAHNVVRDVTRKPARWRELPTSDVMDQRDHNADPALLVERRERDGELWRRVASLPVSQRVCVMLRFFEDRSVDEVARSLRKGNDAVRALQYRAVRTLAAMYPAERSS